MRKLVSTNNNFIIRILLLIHVFIVWWTKNIVICVFKGWKHDAIFPNPKELSVRWVILYAIFLILSNERINIVYPQYWLQFFILLWIALMWWVYIVQCVDQSLYTGICKDPAKRIKAHNDKKWAKYTASRTPVVLVRSQQCVSHSSAIACEYMIKRRSKAKKQSLIEGSIHIDG